MQTFEYVMSAIGQTKIFANFTNRDQSDEFFTKTLTEITLAAQKRVASATPNTNGVISGLFNAYTEKKFGMEINRMNAFGCKSIYADSGGLQMVTAGKTITPELKQKVFQTQLFSDYGFCFDTIPLESLSKSRNRNERSNISNKVFDGSRHAESAIQTGKDFVNQLTTYDKANASTKGILIVQGNTWQDMVAWFSNAYTQIPESLKPYVAGIAVADTCMGVGELETIEMMTAVHMIAEEYGADKTRHIHLLGVGAINRLRPTIFLARSGFLECVKHISYDSSSHTNTPIYGAWKVDEQCLRTPSVKSSVSIDRFKHLYDFYNSTYAPYLTQEQYLDTIFGEKHEWRSRFEPKVFDALSVEQQCVMMTVMYTYCLYQVENFSSLVEKEFTRPIHGGNAIDDLVKIKDMSDMKYWITNMARFVDTNRIQRKDDLITFDC